MTEKFVARAIVTSLAALLWLSFAQAQEAVTVQPQPLQTITMSPGLSTLVSVKRPFKRIEISDEKVVDAIAQTDRNIALLPKSFGSATVIFLDEKGEVISDILVRVQQEALKEPEVGFPTFEEIPGRVTVHDQKELIAATYYRCNATGCELVSEVPTREPSPRVSTSTSVQHRQENGDVKTTTQTQE